ncbi:MAG: hypothetical protein AAFQ67_03480, partial [Pseudomonadota bacterium]
LAGSGLRNVFDLAPSAERNHDTAGQIVRALGETARRALQAASPMTGVSSMSGGLERAWIRLPLLDDQGSPTLVLCFDEVVEPSKTTQKSRGLVQHLSVGEAA